MALALICVLSLSLVYTASAAGPDTKYSVVSGGMSHTLAVKSDGSVWAFGSNESGQLGQSGKTESKIPVKVEGISAVSVAAGYNFSAALQYDGTVYTWGGGNSAPSKVAGLSSVSAIAAGQTDMLALKYDGTVWQWTAGSVTAPRQVNGLQKIMAVAVGGGHFIALSVTGQVWTWGSNSFGQLGLGDNQDRTVPVKINQLSDIIDIAAGYTHSLAVDFNGTVYAWGSNTYGQLGNGTTSASLVPVQIQNFTNVKQISAGTDSSMALLENGSIYTWGYGEYGQMGVDSATITQTSPRAVNSYVSGNSAFIVCGLYHNLMVNSWGEMYAWGRNKNGQLGNQMNTNSTTPQRILSLSVNGTYSFAKYAVVNLQGLQSWSETDIKALYATNLISPRLWCDFQNKITRAEFTHLLLNVYEEVMGCSMSGPLTTSFTDIEGNELRQDIIKANRYGLVNGRSPTIFAPNDCLTREEAVTALCTLLMKMKSLYINTSTLPGLPYYSDADAIGKWAVPYVAYAHDNNIMMGSNGKMNPKGYITREESLATIARIVARYSWHA